MRRFRLFIACCVAISLPFNAIAAVTMTTCHGLGVNAMHASNRSDSVSQSGPAIDGQHCLSQLQTPGQSDQDCARRCAAHFFSATVIIDSMHAKPVFPRIRIFLDMPSAATHSAYAPELLRPPPLRSASRRHDLKR